MGKIDKNRAYGQVIGPADHVYEQDGKFFDAAGEEIINQERTTSDRQPVKRKR